MPEGVKRKISAILSADVVGYSKLMEADEETTVRTMESYRDTISSIVRQHNGRVVDSPGDNILSEFPSVVESVQCAVEVQHVIKAKNAVIPEARRMDFRIGISLEDIIEEDGRVYGDGVNIASRIEGLADAGGICISGAAYEQIKRKLALGYEDLGEHTVKNISWPVQVYRIPLDFGVPAEGRKDRAGPLSEKPSIIVLPFSDLSPRRDNEYFSDGLISEIITDLSHLPGLLVISENTAMTFKGANKRTTEIANEVNVRYALEGSVRKAANNLRIIAQLIDASTDTHLWSEKYSGTLDDIFDIQEKVSRSIVDALELKLSPEESRRIADRPIDDARAYEYYLRAVGGILRFEEAAIESSLHFLQNAVDIIGDNAILYSGMAFAYWNMANIGIRQEANLNTAVDYARKALSIDPKSPNANTVLGLADMHNARILHSIPYFRTALHINPNELLALAGIINVYLHAGKIPAADSYCDRLMRVDPLSFPANWMSGACGYYSGRFDLALEGWQKLYDRHPDNPYSYFQYALILAYDGRTNEVISIIGQNSDAFPNSIFTKLAEIVKYAILGQRENLLAQITPGFEGTIKRDPTLSHSLSSFLSLAGEKEEAINWLENAVNIGFINYPFLNDYDAFLENLRGEERFKKLMERVKYEWENFKVE